jgi:hypothetical protein
MSHEYLERLIDALIAEEQLSLEFVTFARWAGTHPKREQIGY